MKPRDSISRRLQRVIVLTTGTVLALACGLFVFLEWRNSLNSEKNAALSKARIKADASAGMLAFGNRAEAEKLLQAFRADPDVLAAALYDKSGRLYAQYRIPSLRRPIPPAPRADGLYAEATRLIVLQPVVEREGRFGTLYLEVDLRDMFARMTSYGWIALVIFSLALVGAYFIGHLLQQDVARPILSLAGTAQSISRERDYTVRAESAKGGELEILTTAFNQMLGEIHRQQQALAREKQLLATTLASIGDAVIVTDEGGRVTFLNPEAERLTAWSSAEAVGRVLPEVFRIINEEDREMVENPVGKALQHGKVVGLANHTLLVTKKGTEIPVDDSAAPIRGGDGTVQGVVLVFRDFTERKAMEAQLKALALFPQQNPAPIMRLAEDGKLLHANPAALERLEAWNLVVGRPAPTVIGSLSRNALRAGKPAQHEISLGDRSFLVTFAPIPESNYTNLYWADVTERKRAAEALREAHTQLSDRAVQLEKLVSERTVKLTEMVNELQHVSYAIVHDMRAPLRAMSNFASEILELVSADTQLPPVLQDYCQRIIIAACRLDKLIQDSLSYTKMVLHEVQLQPVDLSRLIPGLIETYPNLQPDKADIQIEDPLPTVMGVESLLTQCFSNLLGNAVKFVPPGVRPQIRVRCQRSQNIARITVEDNGIGISRQAQTRLFGMFQRLTSEYEGTGIGLAIVRKVVERMGGRVGADSELGKGSRFWVELRPADTPSDPEPKTST